MSEIAGDVVELGNAAQLDFERQVLRHCQAGDWSDYGWLVQRYQRLVWAAVDAVVEPDATADVVQDVFAQVYLKLGSFRHECSFGSWLWKVARNHALQHRRSAMRRPRPISLDQPQQAGETGGTAMSAYISAASASPEQEYIEEARGESLQRMLVRLPSEYREVLNLHYLGEHTYEDIAQLTRTPLNTVRTRLRRAKMRLAEMAQAEGWN